jgi:hypothetical protein
MKRFNFNFKILLMMAFAAFIIASCSESSETGANYARLQVRLTDSPGDYQEVNVDIQRVQVHVYNEDSEDGWIDLDVNAGVYDLLKLTNGLDTVLATGDLPAGKISQIRLILGDNNSIKVDDEIIPLKTPSAQQSGLKVKVNTELSEGFSYTILLDFDAARSIVKAGASGKYILKPVIRGIAEATTGSIAGTVSNPEASPAVYAIIDTDTLGTSFTNEMGEFMIKGLPSGTYLVSFAPAEGFVIEGIEGVEVTAVNITDLGEVLVEEE